jgi:hypothetical protein
MRRTLAGSGLLIALFCALTLSATPQLHERIHPDAKLPQHECAVTLIAAGNYHHAAPTPIVAAPASAVQFSQVPALNPIEPRHFRAEH